MMALLSAFKVFGIWVADTYTGVNEPWKPLTRPFLPKTLRSLAEREAEVALDFQESFRNNGETSVNHVFLPEPQPLDMGDQAIWAGVGLAALCFKYSIAPSPDLEITIGLGVEGLRKHQMFHNEGKPRLIRGYDVRLGKWEDDASNDSLSGHLLGIWAAYHFGPPAVRMRCVELAQGITARLIADDFKLTNADGSTTKHGKLINGALTDPLQFTLVFALLSFVENLNIDSRVSDIRRDFYRKYGSMIPYGKVSLGAKDNWNDEHRAAIHLMIIGNEDKSPSVHGRVLDGCERLWRLTRNRANPWVNALIARAAGDYLPGNNRAEMRRIALQILGEYEMSDARYPLERINADRMLVGANGASWKADLVTYGGKLRSTQPLPLWAMGAQDFPFQRHRFSVNDWIGQLTSGERYFGCAYMAPYWLSRLSNLLVNTD